MADSGSSDGTGQVALITGGSKGIGEGCARVFCAAGWRVLICARGAERGDAVAAELSSRGPGECRFEQCDVTRPEGIRRVVNRTAEAYGRIDCLVNNAGWHPPHRPIDGFSIEEFDSLWRLNVASYFAASKYALPYLRRVRGSIVNVGSLVATMGQEHATTYCATKGAVSAFSRALAIDEARNGVRVNAILPGNIVTPMRQETVQRRGDPAAVDALIDSWQWPGRSGTVEEVGQACLFLASGGAAFITGVELVVSGGAELGYGIKAPWRMGLDLPKL